MTWDWGPNRITILEKGDYDYPLKKILEIPDLKCILRGEDGVKVILFDSPGIIGHGPENYDCSACGRPRAHQVDTSTSKTAKCGDQG